jgi:hypothetical protein
LSVRFVKDACRFPFGLIDDGLRLGEVICEIYRAHLRQERPGASNFDHGCHQD